jgi:hypothetical protein
MYSKSEKKCFQSGAAQASIYVPRVWGRLQRAEAAVYAAQIFKNGKKTVAAGVLKLLVYTREFGCM